MTDVDMVGAADRVGRRRVPVSPKERVEFLRRATELGAVVSMAIDTAPPGATVDVRAIVRAAGQPDVVDRHD